MDPISALSLACNVLQVIETSIESATLCKELYERGSTDEHDQIEKYAAEIVSVNNDLQIALKSGRTTGRSPRLEQVAHDAAVTANELKIVLNRLKLSKSQGIRRLGGAFKNTIKTLVTSGKITKLQQTLERQDAALRSTLLKTLYIKEGQDDLARRSEFKKLAQGQQELVLRTLKAHQLLSSEISGLIKSSEENITAKLGSQSIQLDKNSKQLDFQIATFREDRYNTRKKDLLKCLAFPEINERRNMIEGRVNDFGKTYKWIFSAKKKRESASDTSVDEDESNSALGSNPEEVESPASEVSDKIFPAFLDMKPLNGFPSWLQGDTDLFWISGKPGSGKSTMMDYIYHNVQPGKTGSDLLKSWCGSDAITVLTFWFFRPVSTSLLKNLSGFWRSLCFQILDSSPYLANTIRQDTDGKAPSTLKTRLLPDGSNAETWTDQELRKWFWYMIEYSDAYYFLLIDGLDEIESNRELLLDTVLEFSKKSKRLKVCCASRPENPFQNALNPHPHIALQDFNMADIQEHCKKRLQGTRAQSLAKTIGYRAQGVFLWARLVSDDLARAASDGESEDDLKLRLLETPDEMSEIFKFMLLKQDKFYSKRPKPFLRLVDLASNVDVSMFASRSQSPTLFELLIANLPSAKLPDLSAQSGIFDWSVSAYLEEQLDGFGSRLQSMCAGLVEFTQIPAPPELDGDSSQLAYVRRFPRIKAAMRTQVLFIHRSVRDFLREDPIGAAYFNDPRLADDELLQLLMSGVAISMFLDRSADKSLSNLERTFFAYAEKLSKDGWDTHTIGLVDAFLNQLELRSLPVDYNNLDKSLKDLDLGPRELNRSLSLECLDLNIRENFRLGFCCMYSLETYVEVQVRNAGPTRQHALAAFALCVYLQCIWSRREHRLVAAISPYLDPDGTYTFVYPGRSYEGGLKEQPWISRCSLTAFVVLSRIKYIERWIDFELDYLQLPREVLEPRADSVAGIAIVEGWIVSSSLDLAGSYVQPPPDNDDNAYIQDLQRSQNIFKCQVQMKHILQNQFFPVKLTQWSPSGISRFLPIDEAVQAKFCKPHTPASWAALRQELCAHLAKSVNSLRSDMSLEEFKTILHNDKAWDSDNDGNLHVVPGFLTKRTENLFNFYDTNPPLGQGVPFDLQE